MSPASLLSLIPPELCCLDERPADEQNAYFPWREAAKHLARLEEVDELVTWKAACDCGKVGCVDCRPVCDAEFCRRAEQIIGANTQSLALLREGLARERFWVGLRPFMLDGGEFSMMGFRHFARLLTLQAQSAQEAQQWQQAADCWRDVMRLGGKLARGGLGVQYLVASAIQGMAVEGVAELAVRHPGRAVLDQLAATVAKSIDITDERTVLRRELQQSLHELEQVPAHSLTDLVDHLLFNCYWDRPIGIGEEVADDWQDDGRLAKRREQIMALLGSHPEPFNAVDAAQQIIAFAAHQSAEIEGTTQQLGLAANRAPVWEDPCDWWPPTLSPNTPVDQLGDSPAAKAARLAGAKSNKEYAAAYPSLRHDHLAFLEAGQFLTDVELSEASEQLRQIPNPAGRLFASFLLPTARRAVREQAGERIATAQKAVAKSRRQLSPLGRLRNRCSSLFRR